MEIKEITKKNVLGAFLGGFVGLLAFGYSKNFYLLGFGVILGVLIGWCYQEIYCNIIAIYKKSVLVGKKSLNYVCIKTGEAKQAVNKNHAWIIRAFAVIIVFLISYLFIRRFFIVGRWDYINCFILSSFPMSFLFSKEKSPFNQRFKNYQSINPLKFFFSDIISLFRVQIFWIIMAYFGFIYFSITGFIFLLFALLSITYIISIKAIYKAVKLSGYWICLFTTMAITVALAYFLLPFIENVILLWIVAFCNGIICGLVAEALRRGIEWLFYHTETGRHYIFIKTTEHIKDSLSPSFDRIFDYWKAMNFKKLLYDI
ncbi:hypothetical protein ACFL23_00220 [Patescibacteria group bacterium]